MKSSLTSTYFLVMWVTIYLVSTFCLFWRVVILFVSLSPLPNFGFTKFSLASLPHIYIYIYIYLVNITFLIYVGYLPSLSFYTCIVRGFHIGIINRHYSHRQLFLLKLHLCSSLFSVQRYFLSFFVCIFIIFLDFFQLCIFVKYHMIYQLRTWMQQSYIFALCGWTE